MLVFIFKKFSQPSNIRVGTRSGKKNTLALIGLEGSGKTTLFYQVILTLFFEKLLIFFCSFSFEIQLLDEKFVNTLTSMKENEGILEIDSKVCLCFLLIFFLYFFKFFYNFSSTKKIIIIFKK